MDLQGARTKIVATVGPATSTPAALQAIVTAGADVLRVNGSHTPPQEIDGWVRRIRLAARRVDRPVAVLVDLPGTKVRVGRFVEAGFVDLAVGAGVLLYEGQKGGDATRLPVHPMPHLDRLRPGTRVLLADGQMELVVVRRTSAGVEAEVLVGGRLLAGKGADFPGARLPSQVPTPRDARIARAALEADADLLALSFVRDGEDVARARRLVEKAGRGHVPLIAKIEREDAVDRIDAILMRAEAVIVARGDLGVDVPPERVPSLQRRILEACRRHGTPAIVATEMLESMVERSRPTRAEASDVAGAVFEGADGVMLSAETAVGRHPALAVSTMDRILRAAEADPMAPYAGSPNYPPPSAVRGRHDAQVVHAAVGLAGAVSAAAIVVFTREGHTAMRLSKERPRAPIVAYAPTAETCRRLSMAWGVRARRMPGGRTTDGAIEGVRKRLVAEEQLPAGSTVVLVMGGAGDPAGATTLVKVLEL